MREILFRGKWRNNGLWIEGDLRQYPSGAKYIKSEEFTHIIEVDPDTVGQYTGLKDKNGQRIFEGDIVERCFDLIRGETKKTRETFVGAVWYMNTEGRFCLGKTNLLRAPWGGDTIEVIGTIHDNPELLKERMK